jgi:hypothetical protein
MSLWAVVDRERYTYSYGILLEADIHGFVLHLRKYELELEVFPDELMMPDSKTEIIIVHNAR